MKLNVIQFALAALAATAAATSIELPSNITQLSNNITDLPLKVTLAPDAVDTLKADGMWAPDPDSFSRGQPNVNIVNITAEDLKFKESGLNINELVSVNVDDQTAAAVGHDKALANTDVCAPYPSCCDQCHTCEEACLSLILCLACWIICEGACQGQDYCKGNGCD